MMRLFTTRAVFLSVVACALLGAPQPAVAQQTNVGPAKCGDCHDHEDEKDWSQKRDGLNGKFHLNAKKALDKPEAAEYGKAIGLADVYDVKGTCVKCHATVVRNRASFGISCESCHGPGSEYLAPHQEKGSYQKIIDAKIGMLDVRKKPEKWVKDCLVCHVLGENDSDPKLAAAGHPRGDDFVVGVKFKPVSGHWPAETKYTENQIGAIGNPVRTALLAKLPKAGGAKPAEPAPTPTPAPTPPAAATDKPEATAPAAAPPTGAGPPPTAAPPTPAPVARRPVFTAPPGLPRNTAAPATTPVPTGGDAQTIVNLPPDPQLPPTPTGIVASIQGRLVALLANLLNAGTTTPTRVAPPTKKTVYRGADAELLRLQDEVIALALEALSTAPPSKTPAKQ
jgi:hypothetical protein